MKCPYIRVTHYLYLCRFAEFKLLNKRVKIMIKRLFVLGLFLVASFAGFAQVSVTGVQGMRVDTFSTDTLQGEVCRLAMRNLMVRR